MATMLGQLYQRKRPRKAYPVRELEQPNQGYKGTDLVAAVEDRPHGYVLGELSEARRVVAKKHRLGDRWQDDDADDVPTGEPRLFSRDEILALGETPIYII
jgi:hypothetical protein